MSEGGREGGREGGVIGARMVVFAFNSHTVHWHVLLPCFSYMLQSHVHM